MPPEVRAGAINGLSKYSLQGSSLQQMIDRGVVFAGSSDTVAAQILRFQEQVGPFGNLMIMGQAGYLRKDDVVASLTRMAREVLPRVEDGLAVAAAS
jgi:alkanesulfonate monooxygenase SsuD/methylene tetrahydromethanopterin reductase-like flavin-dependent oxidoreductase (luciferase family)